ncbi:protein of unknown function DUF395 YeeE/YedE [Denitrovibrio acetiphilus DSM 12809]|uniref:Uncharacterized protein n=1 Tax=Denitrovibrio acetiphilus (strain DSM 12809 / NBRC 114555 / N2460) TaxID=522772 RepID=D4H254_DENA2|nr:YeeE/YedE thiosulfate transporter family protein [Denitrovibrio acetiphilus]ADD68845.1 protein of unknown function DUF395 YeeE/YedE [Denitrovibrio acetiphilus DSM 12809]
MFLKRGLFTKKLSPWLTGSLTGITAAACCVFAGKTLGASGGFVTIDSYIGNYFNTGWAKLPYFTAAKPPILSFQIIQYIGMLAGAIISALMSKDFHIRSLPAKEWKPNFGKSVVKRWIMIFIGGILVELGACIAGGCTSGLGISGIIQLSPAGFIFFISAFTSGIITAGILFRRT